MSECVHSQQVLASIPGIEVVQCQSEGPRHEHASPILIPATTAHSDSVDSSTVHTRLSDSKEGEIGGTRRGQTATRRPLFDTFGRLMTRVEVNGSGGVVSDATAGRPGAVEGRDTAQDYASQSTAPPPVLIGAGATKGGTSGGEKRSSHVHNLQRANIGDFFKVWAGVNNKFVLLTAHEEIDTHWEGLAQSFSGQAMFFQVGLRAIYSRNGAGACNVDF